MKPTGQETVPFLRRAALELRRIADVVPPEIAERLRVMASELDLDANELSRESLDRGD